MTETVTREGKILIDAWMRADANFLHLRRNVIQAGIDLAEATDLLAKWLLPGDAKPGEKIAVWYGDSLVQVEAPHDGQKPTITVRTRGKSMC